MDNRVITLIDTPRGEISLRQARVEDASAFHALRLEALQDSPTAFSADYEVNAARPESYFEERLRELGEGGTIYFAWNGEELLGMCGLHRGESPKTQHSALIWGVYVKLGWRGLRIAGALIEACIAWGRAHGVKVVKLGVSTNNEAALRCYKRCGFKVYGREPQAIFYEGVMYDEFLMMRPI